MSFFNVGKFSLTNTDASSVVLTVPNANLTEYTLTLPDNSGTSGYVLQTDGTGVTSWAAQSGSLPAAISAGQVIFADGGDFSGNDALTFSAGTGTFRTTDINATNNIEAAGDVSGATANFGSITATGQISLVDVSATNIDLTGDIAVTGQTTLVDVSATNLDLTGAIAVTGQTTLVDVSATNIDLTGAIGVTGQTTLVDVSATNLDLTGAVSGVTASFSTSTTTKANIMTPNIVSAYNSGSPAIDVNASVNIITYSNAGDATATFNGVNNGQISHIVYNNGGGGSLQVDFGATKLVSGSGNNRYLTFNSQGQSAAVIYSTTANKYFIINTGALVS